MIYGFAKFGPEQVMAMLLQANKRGVKIVPPAGYTAPAPADKHLIFLDYRDFLTNVIELRRLKLSVYVFAPKFELRRWNIYTRDEEYSSVLDVPLENSRPPILPRGRNLLRTVLTSVQQCALLGKLMDVIYDLPSKSGQKPVTAACCEWLNSDASMQELEARLTKLVKKELIRNLILKQMKRDIAQRLRQALKAHREGMSVEDASSEFNVRPYEICYVLGSITRKQDATDTYVSNVGE